MQVGCKAGRQEGRKESVRVNTHRRRGCKKDVKLGGMKTVRQEGLLGGRTAGRNAGRQEGRDKSVRGNAHRRRGCK